ncbi:MAG: PTS sugar transporter subunit IIA, partial [Propionibacteriaceae bacterium]|nr:PTS sugar transporter subunit IIA [Propionibacteriaceae bacterium]
DVQMPDSDAAIDFLCAQLVATGKVPDDFAASVKIREEYSPTAFVHRFAVPHAMEFMAYETTIAVLIPRQPIHWGESDVVMVLMLAINRDGIAEFSAAYQPLVHLLCQPDIFAQVHSLREFDDFQRFLTEKVAEIE